MGILMGHQTCLVSWDVQDAPLQAGCEGTGSGAGVGDGDGMGLAVRRHG